MWSSDYGFESRYKGSVLQGAGAGGETKIKAQLEDLKVLVDIA